MKIFTHYKSMVTGNLYPVLEYINHGYSGIKMGYKDLPSDEYPYRLINESEILIK